MRIIIWNICLALFCNSCISVELNGPSPHNNKGYNNLSEAEKKRIVFLSDTITIHIKNDVDTMVYAVSPSQLKTYINQFDSCLIYFWSPFCTSESCKSPTIIRDYCKNNNLKLILVAEEYRDVTALLDILSLINQPTFVINSSYFKSDIIWSYIPKFKKEFFGKDYKKKDYCRYHIYNHTAFRRVEF